MVEVARSTCIASTPQILQVKRSTPFLEPHCSIRQRPCSPDRLTFQRLHEVPDPSNHKVRLLARFQPFHFVLLRRPREHQQCFEPSVLAELDVAFESVADDYRPLRVEAGPTIETLASAVEMGEGEDGRTFL